MGKWDIDQMVPSKGGVCENSQEDNDLRVGWSFIYSKCCQTRSFWRRKGGEMVELCSNSPKKDAFLGKLKSYPAKGMIPQDPCILYLPTPQKTNMDTQKWWYQWYHKNQPFMWVNISVPWIRHGIVIILVTSFGIRKVEGFPSFWETNLALEYPHSSMI